MVMSENSLSELNSAQIEQEIAQYIEQLGDHPQPAEVYFNLGDLYASQEKLALAIKNYRQAIALKKDFAAAHRQLALVLAQHDSDRQSADHLFKAFKLNPETVTAQQYYELGQTLQVQNKIPKAIACYRAAIKSQPSFWEAHQNLFSLLLKQKKFEPAIGLYRRGAKNNPQDSRYYLALALAFASRKKWVRACNNYQQAAQIEPSAKIYYHWGLAEYALEEYAQASSHFQAAAELKPSAKIYYHWGLTAYALNQYDQAQQCYQEAISLDHNYVLACYQLGVLWQDQQQWRQAIAAYKQVIALKPKFKRALVNMGRSYRHLQEYDLAIACYQKAIKLIAKTSPLETLAFAGYHQTLAEHPQISAQHYHRLGKLLRAQGHFSQAITAYCESIKLDPQFQLAYIDLQYTPIDQEQSTDLIKFYRQILVQHPQTTIAWGNLGDVLTQSDRLAEAIDCYRRGSYQQAIQLYPHLAESNWQPEKKSGPDFIIAGASKCGTTAIYQYLSHHPQILFSHKKEIDFFWKNYQRGVDWYLAHFPTITDRDDFLTGEATPNYIRFPQVARRIKKTFPHTKIIILLRNPVDRAISWHYHKLNSGLTKLDLATAIATEIERLANVSEAEIINTGYYNPDNILSSLYIYKIRPWIETLGREQFLILNSEDFYLNPLKNMQQVFKFLSLPNCSLDSYPKVNAGSYNQADSTTRKTLSDYFASYNLQLEEYLGMKFNWE